MIKKINDLLIRVGRLIPVDIFNSYKDKEIKRLSDSLDISEERKTELDKLLAPIKKLDIANTYLIPLVTSFSSKYKNRWNIPVPFLNFRDKLENLYISGFATDMPIVCEALFWRLYACYRHGLSWKITLQQIDMYLNSKVSWEINFWKTEIPILLKALKPYVIVNRYMIIPINRLAYKISIHIRRK